ncbi:hypothetical protein LNAOJCKE_0916 [Methylorubrum aminovorans]|uniref:Uncharacterized protein n=1 Tax=Methylorubrum aminovorans TaxID=269069 RepID=A0ABQ4U8T9_9HYPH|nr:hypothetical protein [Methylorubrum aminovorans]GJE63718.1 hypothetical protein LNAOJCKE_0916 [Methylorubrum aminovorans]GMA73648.1 hypothetical protein GCM10025880_00650 [Methylorubrum aminovorans]GMA79834.1 hypothetical protein GCM10025880_62510 [Methylorubrum aminovorans]
MSSRQISNLTFRSALQADRVSDTDRRDAIAAMHAKKLAEAQARDAARTALTAAKASPLFVSGSFDLAAVMRLAHARAKQARASGSTASWADLIRSSMRNAWSEAKAQRRSAAH